MNSCELLTCRYWLGSQKRPHRDVRRRPQRLRVEPEGRRVETHPRHPQDQPRRHLRQVVSLGEQICCGKWSSTHICLLLWVWKWLVSWFCVFKVCMGKLKLFSGGKWVSVSLYRKCRASSVLLWTLMFGGKGFLSSSLCCKGLWLCLFSDCTSWRGCVLPDCHKHMLLF